MTGKTILLCGDSHASPQSPNRRYTWLGNLIVERQPDVIVSIGDFADMSTLSSYDKGTKASWGKLYKDDVRVTREAQELMFAPLTKYNNTVGKKKKAQYKPLTVHTLGNHDDGRYNTFNSKNPEMSEHITIKDLEYDKWWTHVVPYLDTFQLWNIAFSHFFYTKSQRYPAATAAKVLQINHQSSVMGHSHSYDFAHDYNRQKTKITAVNPGCFLDNHEKGDTYNYTGGQGRDKWWNGLVMLNDVNEKGEFDVEQININRIEASYG